MHASRPNHWRLGPVPEGFRERYSIAQPSAEQCRRAESPVVQGTEPRCSRLHSRADLQAHGACNQRLRHSATLPGAVLLGQFHTRRHDAGRYTLPHERSLRPGCLLLSSALGFRSAAAAAPAGPLCPHPRRLCLGGAGSHDLRQARSTRCIPCRAPASARSAPRCPRAFRPRRADGREAALRRLPAAAARAEAGPVVLHADDVAAGRGRGGRGHRLRLHGRAVAVQVRARPSCASASRSC
jgi:hypothetical protein